MWQQTYTPIAGSLGVSALLAAIPILALVVMLGVLRRPAWQAALAALAAALIVALGVYRMPGKLALAATLYGVATGLFPIAWIVFTAIMLYRLTVDVGGFAIIKDSVGGLTADRRLQAMLIAFAFGAFIEGAAGFGSPVAVSGAMLAGLGFSPFYAAGICLLANTAPVAFGSLGIPVTTLATVTGLPLGPLSAMVGRLCAMISVIVPGYLVVVMTGRARAREVLPAIAACGLSFGGTQFLVSNFVGPELTDILSSLVCIVVMVAVIKAWKPPTVVRLEGDHPATTVPSHGAGALFGAWVPYLMLVAFVLVWGIPDVKVGINRWTDRLLPSWMPTLSAAATKTAAQLNRLRVPGLHNAITQMPPVRPKPTPYGAVYEWNWLGTSGTACLLAIIAAALVLRIPARKVVKAYVDTFRQLKLALLTIASMLALAFLMNYSGMTSTMGLALAGTGAAFPFFGAVVGWIGVFLTGSDTSANALFGNLQAVTAHALGLNPILTASVNSAAGVMGKMISVQSIAVAVAATGMSREDEGRLFRFTIKHSALLMVVMALLSLLYAYALPGWVPRP
jgi:lactate permease